MMMNLIFFILKIFLILYFVEPSVGHNKTERNGKVFREYFFLEKFETHHKYIKIFTLLSLFRNFRSIALRIKVSHECRTAKKF